jgi:hypothetical protein
MPSPPSWLLTWSFSEVAECEGACWRSLLHTFDRQLSYKNLTKLSNRAFTLIYSTSVGVSLILHGLHEDIPKVDQKGRKNKRKDKTPFWPKAKQRRNKKPNPTYTIGLTHTTATT